MLTRRAPLDQGSSSAPAPLEAFHGKIEARAVSDEVVQLWTQGIQRMKGKAATADAALKQSFDNKIEYFGIAVKLRGKCCAEDE